MLSVENKHRIMRKNYLNDMERESKLTMVSMENKHIIHLNDIERESIHIFE